MLTNTHNYSRMKFAQKISFIPPVLVALLLPLSPKLVPSIIALWFVIWLLEGNFKEKFAFILNQKPLLLMMTFYLINILGLAFTENMKAGLFDTEVKLSLFLIPLLITSSVSWEEKYFSWIKTGFVSGLVLACLFYGSIALVRYFDTHDHAVLLYRQLTLTHPSYMALYLIFAIGIIWFRDDSDRFLKRSFTAIRIFTIAIFIVFLILGMSRAGYIAGFVLVLFFAVNSFRKKENRLVRILLFISFLVISTIIFMTNSRFESIRANGISQILEKDIRIQIWKQALPLAEDSLITGVGTGDVKDELLVKYKEAGLKDALENKLNSHNEFIETTLRNGIAGLLLLLSLFILPFMSNKSGKDKKLFILFLLASFISFCFESMLNVQAGTVFFAFFYSILVSSVALRKSNV